METISRQIERRDAPRVAVQRKRARWRVPGEVACSLAVTLAALGFLGHEDNPFWANPISHGHPSSGVTLSAGVGAFLLTTLVSFGALVLIARRWQLGFVSTIIMLGGPPVAVQAVRGFSDVGLAVLGVLGAAVAAAMLAAGGVGPARPVATRWLLALAPVLYWGVYVAGVAAHDRGVGWSTEAWAGTLVWSGLLVAALHMLASFPLQPRRAVAHSQPPPRSSRPVEP